MYEGNVVELRQKEVLLDIPLNEQAYHGNILVQDEEQLAILLSEDKLKEISLDTIYECRIFLDTNDVLCEGRVSERYISQTGRIVLFQIQKGFYELNVKEV